MKADEVARKVERMQKASLMIPIEEVFHNMKTYASKSTIFKLEYRPSQEISAELRDKIYQLFESNMKAKYVGSSWGYNEEEKRQELADEANRFLILRDSSNQLAAFLSFRFVEENLLPTEDDEEGDDAKVDAIYCFELQINTTYRRQGLGAFLMRVFEHIGSYYAASKAMLTVFKSNRDAFEFYKQVGYAEDEISPSQCLVEEEAAKYDWEIMSKQLPTVTHPET